MNVMTGTARIEIEDPGSVTDLIRQMESQGEDCVVVEKSEGLHITVLPSPAHYVIIFEDYTTSRGILNASRAPAESAETVSVTVGGTPTPIPQNMCLTREVGLQVVLDFCRTGEPSPVVYWLRDAPRSETLVEGPEGE